MTTSLDFIVELLDSIERGEMDTKLDTISKAIEKRKAITRSAVTLDDFVVGDRVVINERCGTKYLLGEEATVVGIRRTKLTIQFENPKGRFVRKNADGTIYSSDVVVPIDILDKKK
jgi:hypothetical protein